MAGLHDFRSHSKSRPFADQPLFDHSKSRLVQILTVVIYCKHTFIKWGSEDQPFDNRIHLRTKIFEVGISNGR